ncbi:MAG: glycosyltransferase [Candidatus Omnitrophota bacterium]|jgi:glycosyltransferase involved in cell wall biosynthesis|nr:MAG: glycosyltransferase [Candidatus Omnitrophota bacterium]
MPDNNILYISYDGMLEPIAQSQVIPYLKGLSKDKLRFFLLSFEKKALLRDKDHLRLMEERLRNAGIFWKRLVYHKKPQMISTLLDCIFGLIYAVFIVKKNRIRVVHARAEVSSLIGWLCARLCGCKFIYDRRGVLAYDYVDGGMWPKESLITKIMFKAVNYLDAKFLFGSDYTVVLTNKMADILKSGIFVNKKHAPKIKVIPCCVDLDNFNRQTRNRRPEDFPPEGKSVMVYCGSIGTWYMLREMIEFFKVLKSVDPKAHFLIITPFERDLVINSMHDGFIKDTDFTVLSKKHYEMPAYLSWADAAIMFIKPVFSKLASCPTKFGEYLACGLPVVINSGIGDTAGLIEENKIGSVLKEFSSAEYRRAAEELQYLINDAGLKNRCRNVAVTNLSLVNGIESYSHIYNTILNN